VSDVLLELRDLSVTYQVGGGRQRSDVPAVRHVDLRVGAGDTIGLAGESGCGKSTVAAAVLRLLPPDARVEGQILLDGQDVATMSPGQLRAVRWTKAAIVFQGALHSLNPVQRVGRQIGEAIEVHAPGPGNRRAVQGQVAELLEQVGLPAGRARHYPHQLSGGQRQRVLIALALACRPRLLIADEPTTALDVMVQAQVLEVLARRQREEGMAMIFITHDLSVLRSVCRQLAVMYAGRIVEEGPSEAVLGQPSHPYTRALAAAFPTIGEAGSRLAPRGLGGDPPDPAQLPAGCSFHPRCPQVRPECATAAVELRPAGPDRRAACVLVGP
jgi:peptide/nickel transport system ATP-binding protein